MNITPTNLYVLRQLKSLADADGRLPNRISPTDRPHARKLLAADMIRLDGEHIVITAKGDEELARRSAEA